MAKVEDFCHLHVHTTYSQLDGYGLPDEYAKRAAKLGFKYLACTDHGNIDGLIKFQNACQKHGVKPILGCEVYFINEYTKKKTRGHACLWVKNRQGFKNLCKLLSIANLEGFYYKPRISFEAYKKHYKGLCVGTACLQSFINIPDGLEFFQWLKSTISDDLYCEIMPHYIPEQIKFNQHVIKLAKQNGVKVIATNDTHYIKRNDHRVQEIMLAIQRKAKWDDPKRWKFEVKGLHLRRPSEMEKALLRNGSYLPKYMKNTMEVAEKCGNFIIPKRDIRLPHVPGLEDVSENKYLHRLCMKGFRSIFGHSILKSDTYRKRLNEELTLIYKKNFSRYFLIVWELCNWCRENNILIGPGRGSVGGSLVAYLLRITTVDPIQHKLIFSRFINEDRIDYPDIDIDFEHEKQYLVKEHLEAIYGEGNVANVSTFNRLKARAAIQDVARVFDIAPAEVNRFTKLIEDEGDNVIDLAVATYDEAKEFSEQYPKVIKYAKKLEGQIRTYSQHAAAIVVSMQNIAKSGRCNLIERNGVRLVNWEKDDSEYVGLMKLDALSVKVLSIISKTLDLIKENHLDTIDLPKLNLEDEAVLKEINDGNNVGVFQLNTWAMTSLIKDMGVSTFRHIVDSIALVRPGPMNSGMTEKYIERKHGARWAKLHPVYEELTQETYGVIVFQEQVMQVINVVAGLGYTTADKIRKIIGKKRDVKEFAKYEKMFFKGCRKTKIFSTDEAKDFWRGLQEHARYSFNLAHSVEYAMLGYWCAWLKKYFPTEFICASLTYGAKEKKPELVEEAYRLGLTLQLPKVGVNDAMEWKASGRKLLVPFKEVKGLGEVKAKQAARALKPAADIKRFFKKKQAETIKKHDGSLGKLLDSIGAYDMKNLSSFEITPEIKKLFEFRIVANPKLEYEKLYKLFGEIRPDKLDDILTAESSALKKVRGIARKRSFQGHKDLLRCNFCELREQCKRPVPPSPGIYNIAIIGEAPGKDEDREGKGFVGRSGQDLWKAIKIPRKYFHVTNVNKCYPSLTRKPNKEQIALCGPYLQKELLAIKPCLILVFGNTGLQYFEGKSSGIMSISGSTKWSEFFGCWIAYCMHPAATLHNPDNMQYFKAGIKNFRRLVRILAPKIYKKGL